MATLKIKQGETFSLTGAYLQDDGATPKSLAGVTLKSQIRTNRDVLVATLVIAVIDEPGGIYTVSAGSTAAWPVGALFWDIKESLVGGGGSVDRNPNYPG